MNTQISAGFDDYLLSRTSGEYQRLHWQALVWEKISTRVLKEAGLKEAMHFLDVGCGTGDVMRVAGELVGKAGTVTGFDIDEKIGTEALSLLQQLDNSTYSFKHFDVTSDSIPVGYDFIYSRFVLIHMTDPVTVIRKLYDALKPGGILLLQDYDFGALKTSGAVEKTSGFMRHLMMETFTKAGKDPEMGTNLSAYFLKAGIGNAAGTDAASIITPHAVGAQMMRAVTQGFRKAFLQLEVATEEQLDAYIQELDTVIVKNENVFFTWPMLNSAWILKM